MKPGTALPKQTIADRAVYTDDAAESEIIAAVVFGPIRFAENKQVGQVWSLRTGFRTFAETCYIYGLSILALFSILMHP